MHDCSKTEEIDVVLAALMFAQRHEGERERQSERVKVAGHVCVVIVTEMIDVSLIKLVLFTFEGSGPLKVYFMTIQKKNSFAHD